MKYDHLEIGRSMAALMSNLVGLIKEVIHLRVLIQDFQKTVFQMVDKTEIYEAIHGFLEEV